MEASGGAGGRADASAEAGAGASADASADASAGGGTGSGGRGRRSVLRALAGVYFCVFGAMGVYAPFWPLFLVERGLSPVEISHVMIAQPILGMLIPPIWGVLADLSQARQVLLRVALLGAAGGVLLFLIEGGFLICLLAAVVMGMLRAPILPMVDAATHAALGVRPASFSRTRIFGSVAFAIFALLGGWLGTKTTLSWLVVLVSVLFVLAAVFAWLVREVPELRRSGLLARALTHTRGVRLLPLFVGSAFYYAGHATFDVLFGLHARALGLGADFVGLAWTIGVGAEIGLMLFAPWVLTRISARRLLLFAALVSVFRWGSLSVLTDGHSILWTQPLHAVSFGLWFLAFTKLVQDGAPNELRTTLQSIGSAFVGMGQIAGYAGGGWLFEQGGGAWAFRGAAVAAAVGMVTYLFLLASQGADHGRFSVRHEGARTDSGSKV
ncbi:MAG: MFS transporter [Deltaproteobacteria bacterium]|nr:MFS transporter [Deltaproteobacteria bacterium]